VPKLGATSKQRRDTCAVTIQDVLNEAIKHVDFAVMCGHRTESAQNTAFVTKRSRAVWPLSRHNTRPSEAVDIVPWPTQYDDLAKFYELATYMYAAADKLGVSLEWGGHWKNYTGKGHNDRDWAHWELRK